MPVEQENVDLQAFPHHQWNVKLPPAHKYHENEKKKQ